jgi:hypothetical protein
MDFDGDFLEKKIASMWNAVTNFSNNLDDHEWSQKFHKYTEWIKKMK